MDIRVVQGFIFYVLFFCAHSLWGQLPRFTQYRVYRGIINPAALESHYLEFDRKYHLTASASYRSEGWSQQVEAPNTQLLQWSWIPPIGNQFKFLTGGYLYQDQFGPTKVRNGAIRLGAFSYDSPFGHLSLGFNLGVNQYRFELSEGDFTSLGDQVLGADLEQTYFSLGFGLFYSQRLDKNDWYIGFSVPQLFEWDRQIILADEEGNTLFSPQIYVLLGANVYPSNQRYFEPSIWVKYLPDDDIFNDVPTYHVDFNLRHHWIEHQFWVGIGYSTQSTLHTELGFDIGTLGGKNKALRIGLGYDYSTSNLPHGTDHALEINISALLK